MCVGLCLVPVGVCRCDLCREAYRSMFQYVSVCICVSGHWLCGRQTQGITVHNCPGTDPQQLTPSCVHWGQTHLTSRPGSAT